MPHERPHHMRRHDADEPDGSRRRHARACQQRRAADHQQPRPLRVCPEARRRLVAEAERPQARPGGQHQRRADRQRRRSQHDIRPRTVRYRPHHPVHEVGKAIRVRRQVQRQRHQRPRKAGKADADQQQRHAPRPPHRRRGEQHRRDPRAKNGRNRHRKTAHRRKAKEDRNHRAERGESRNAQNARLRQRVLQQTLQARPRQPQRRADSKRRRCPRQPDFPNDRARRRLALPGQRGKALTQRNRRRTGER